MNKMKIMTAFVLATALFVSACSKQEFVVNSRAGIVAEDKFSHFFIGGIGQTQTIDAAAICGGADKIAKVERQYTFVNWLVGFLTLSIYTPRQHRVSCLR